jgi:hypothetical protein
MVLVVIALASMLLMGALALDGGHMLLNKTRLQNAVDAAALSGAKTLFQVKGAPGAAETARTAALNTLRLNADAEGNGELSAGIGDGDIRDFATVEFSPYVYGPFDPLPLPETDIRYVRVWVRNYGLAGFFWSFAQSTFGSGTLGDKAVAAIATAGWSPSSLCDIAPLMVCAEDPPSTDTFWGYKTGDLEVLKTAENNTSGIGPGNFQLLDFGSGGSTVRDLLAGGGTMCLQPGDEVTTKPGNTVGPAIQGLNTRFFGGDGAGPSSSYPPDWVTKYGTEEGSNEAEIGLDATGAIVWGGTGKDNTGGIPLQTDDAGIYYTDPATSSRVDLFDYNDWEPLSAQCDKDGGGADCESDGRYGRRMLRIVIGSCSGTDGGQAQSTIKGFGCFYILQPASQQGNAAHIFGQLAMECDGDGDALGSIADDTAPQVIQLYKTYFSGVDDPSPDS